MILFWKQCTNIYVANNVHSSLPVAVLLVSVTCTVISNDDVLLRTSVGCTFPSVSLILYDGWWKDMVAPMEWNKQSYV